MAASTNLPQARIDRKIEEIRREFSDDIRDLLRELNYTRLNGRGRLAASPIIDRNTLRWTLAWKEGKSISFSLNIVVHVDDDGREAGVSKVWVHRHASTPWEYEGHTPTTRMRRVGSLSLEEIRDAIDLEWTWR